MTDTLDDDARMIEILQWNLQRFFMMKTKEEALEAIEEADSHWKGWSIIDESHHDGPFRVAAKIMYLRNNNWSLGGFEEWLRKVDIWETPYEAKDYFNRNYFD